MSSKGMWILLLLFPMLCILGSNNVFAANQYNNKVDVNQDSLQFESKLDLNDTRRIKLATGIKFINNDWGGERKYYFKGSLLSLCGSCFKDEGALYSSFTNLDVLLDMDGYNKIVYTLGFVDDLNEFLFGLKFLRDEVRLSEKNSSFANEYSVSTVYNRYLEDIFGFRSVSGSLMFSYMAVNQESDLSKKKMYNIISVAESGYGIKAVCGFTGGIVTRKNFDLHYKVDLNLFKKVRCPNLSIVQKEFEDGYTGYTSNVATREYEVCTDFTLFLDSNVGNLKISYGVTNYYDVISGSYTCDLSKRGNQLGLFAKRRDYKNSDNIRKECGFEIIIPFYSVKKLKHKKDFMDIAKLIQKGYSVDRSIPNIHCLDSDTFVIDPVRIFHGIKKQNDAIMALNIETFACDSDDWDRINKLPKFGTLELLDDSGQISQNNMTNSYDVTLQWPKLTRMLGFNIYVKRGNASPVLISVLSEDVKTTNNKMLHRIHLPDIKNDTNNTYTIIVVGYNSEEERKATNSILLEYVSCFAVKSGIAPKADLVAIGCSGPLNPSSKSSYDNPEFTNNYKVLWQEYEVKIDINTPTKNIELRNLEHIEIDFTSDFNRNHKNSWYQNIRVEAVSYYYDSSNKQIVFRFRENRKKPNNIIFDIIKIFKGGLFQTNYLISETTGSIIDNVGNKLGTFSFGVHTHPKKTIDDGDIKRYKNDNTAVFVKDI